MDKELLVNNALLSEKIYEDAVDAICIILLENDHSTKLKIIKKLYNDKRFNNVFPVASVLVHLRDMGFIKSAWLFDTNNMKLYTYSQTLESNWRGFLARKKFTGN